MAWEAGVMLGEDLAGLLRSGFEGGPAAPRAEVLEVGWSGSRRGVGGGICTSIWELRGWGWAFAGGGGRGSAVGYKEMLG